MRYEGRSMRVIRLDRAFYAQLSQQLLPKERWTLSCGKPPSQGMVLLTVTGQALVFKPKSLEPAMAPISQNKKVGA